MSNSELPRGERMVIMYAYLIRNRTRQFTVREIHEFLESLNQEDVTLRNVQRDLKRLAELQGNCITSDRINGKLKYFVQPDLAGKISLPIEKNGLLAMFLLKRLQPFFSSQSKNLEQLGAALREIGERAGGDLFDDLDLNLEQDAYQLGERSLLNIDNEMLNSMLTALVDRCKLEIAYRRPDTEKPELRMICPVKLILYKNELYFVCISEKNQERNYYIKLCRIQSAKATKDVFKVTREALKRIESRLTRSFGMLDDDDVTPETVVLRFPPGWGMILTERRFHNSQKLTRDKKGNCILTMQVPVGTDLVQWVLGWSDNVKAEKPAKLRKLIGNAVAKLAKEYC
jgi:predicted DNA-binding transcriptional regulator YafY